MAILDADYLTERSALDEAEFVLIATFGSETQLPDVRRRLAKIYLKKAVLASEGTRVRLDRSKTIQLAEAMDIQTPDDAKVVVDLLRFSEEFARALKVTKEACQLFPQDIFLKSRHARILEMVHDLSAAALVWESLILESDRLLGEALLRLENIYTRLERADDLERIRTQIVLANISLVERLRFALQSNQLGVAYALAEHVGFNPSASSELSKEDQQKFCDALLDHGEIGLVVWLRRRRISLSSRARQLLDDLDFTVSGRRALPDNVHEAREIRSPNFLLPLEDTLRMPPKPKGWPAPGVDPNLVLLVTSTLGIGGAERQFVETARALIQNGLDKEKLHIGVFSLAEDRGHAHFLSELEGLGISIHPLSHRTEHSATLPSQVKLLLDALPSSLRYDCIPLWHLVNTLKPNVLHGWQDRSAAACGIVGTAQSVERVILSFRNMSPLTRKSARLSEYRGLYRSLADKSNVTFTTNSIRASQDYESWLSLERERITTIYNAFDTSHLSDLFVPQGGAKCPIPAKGKKLRIGGVFRLAINKRPLLWLQTLASLRDEHGMNFEPVLFGSGPLESEVKAEASRLGLDDLKIHQGVINVEELYGGLDILLLMSSVEGLPNVVLEAQAMGKPVACCDVGGSSEALKSAGKGAGLLLPADVTADVAAARLKDWIVELNDVPPALLRRFVEQKFSRHKLGRATYSAYLGHALEAGHAI
ncbi:glycosyltransferase [Cognatishimia activa]|nr:glycosyltransferase [Cognatishimia activa]